jgi:predicted dinucleotide-utilizing enzyme
MKFAFLSSVIVALFFVSGVADTHDRQETTQEKKEEQQEDPTKGSKNVDEVVNYPMELVLEAARQAMETYGCEIKKEKADYLEGTRSRHIGAFVGSGGEKIKVKLSEEKEGTRVKINTGKGFMGRLGKKNWSTPIFKEMMRLLEESSTDLN